MGAMVGAGSGALLPFTVCGILVAEAPGRENVEFAAFLVILVAFGVTVMTYGNLTAVYPYSVSVLDGKGVELRATLKSVFIPIENLRDVQDSRFQGGVRVRLNKPQRLLSSFLIPAFFGDQAEPLAFAVADQIGRHTK